MAFTFLWNGSKQFVKMAGKLRIGAQGDSCCCAGYKQARKCSDNSLADVYMTTADAATLTGAFTLLHGSFGYYFAGDSGTPGTIYTASEATPYANCGAITSGCPNGLCILHADTDLTKTVDFSGPWDLAGCGETSDTDTASTEPISFTVSGCGYSPSGVTLYFPSPTPGRTYRCSGVSFFATNTYADGSGALCWYYGIQVNFQDAHGGPAISIYFRGPRLNGAGSASGTYYFWYSSDSTTFDENDIATNGCALTHVPPMLTVP